MGSHSNLAFSGSMILGTLSLHQRAIIIYTTYTWPNHPFFLGWYHAIKTNPEKQGWVIGRWDHITMRPKLTGSMCSMSIMNLELHDPAAEKHHCLCCCHHITHKSMCTKFGSFGNSKFLISLCYFWVASPAKIKAISDSSVLNIFNYFICRYILHKNRFTSF